jgi:hypothetical protein
MVIDASSKTCVFKLIIATIRENAFVMTILRRANATMDLVAIAVSRVVCQNAGLEALTIPESLNFNLQLRFRKTLRKLVFIYGKIRQKVNFLATLLLLEYHVTRFA